MPKSLAESMSMEERKTKVAELVAQFEREKDYYKSKNYNEANVRKDFIDKFLICLGWDVNNDEGRTESYKRVKVEANQLQGDKTKHPDYELRIGGQAVLYVEAKKPSVNIEDDPEPALQTRKYGYTKSLKLSLLTDFEELSVYDTSIKLKLSDKAGNARIEYYTYDQYVEKFEELYSKYSFEACESGNMALFADSTKGKKGTAKIDDDILEMIEKWRLALANDIALRNETIDEYDLTGIVQRIIDRIIFLRICEDKSIENYETLKNLVEDKSAKICIYERLKVVFNTANEKFNAGLFAKDEFLDNLIVSDKVLSDIIKEIYPPNCPYAFSVLPVEILGTIYEKFLGKVIQFKRKTKNGHSVEVVDKPEVQKAGGVFYTPSYIVRYIVEQTIGEKIKGKTPTQVSELRFVDPAYGSGSFLVGAYDYLLNYHLDYYLQDKVMPKAEKDGVIYKDIETKDYKLSVKEKRRILVNNIYGVDIDAQAVEVAKVSLFLKLLENEGRSLNNDGRIEMFKATELSQEKILPFMGNNIKCGNSLVSTDFDDGELFESKVEYLKVHPFDWKEILRPSVRGDSIA